MSSDSDDGENKFFLIMGSTVSLEARIGRVKNPYWAFVVGMGTWVREGECVLEKIILILIMFHLPLIEL